MLKSLFRTSAIAALVASALVPMPAAAASSPADYPNRPVRFIGPFAPGAGTDMTARLIAAKLSDLWGQQFIVDNRTGAAGAIGVDLTAKAPPDGYTICLISASHSVNSATNNKLPYDLTKDLQGITQATSLFYAVYVHPSVPAKSVKELIAHAKANPDKLMFGSSGTGGLQHFAGEMFSHMSRTRMTHVPYKGSSAVQVAMLAGEVQVGFGTMFGVRPHMQAGKVRVLAITDSKRSPTVPDIPTVAESGIPGYEVDQWYGIVTSAKVPKPIVQKLREGIVKILEHPDVAKRLASEGSTPVGSTPEQFDAHIKSEIAKWRNLVKEAKLDLHN
jgi:tripartite-type tricarboxylate transporter receptor subunit TctC